LVHELERRGVLLVPSRATVYRVLVRNGLVQPGVRKRRRSDFRRWERETAMEIRKLRTERDQSQHNARLHLGRQLDQIGAADLTIRVHELNQSKAELEALLGAKTAETEGLARRVTELEDELTAARTSLRQMIKNQSKGVASST
jgi:predicted nuclease with TOPRIM domain